VDKRQALIVIVQATAKFLDVCPTVSTLRVS